MSESSDIEQPRLKAATKTRPYLKTCTECKGKGMLPFIDRHQDKKYGACNKCAQGKGFCGLGVTLKCACNKLSQPYEYMYVEHLKHAKGLDKSYVKEMERLQGVLRTSGKAILFMCACDRVYLAVDGWERRRFQDPKKFKEDKAFNRLQASVLIANGIEKELRPL